MPKEKCSYTKMEDIECCRLKEFNIYGIITDFSHRITYDRNGKDQDEFRLKINDGTTNEDVNVTAFAALNQIPIDAFAKGKIARFHRLQKAALKTDERFYLYGRIGTVCSLLLFDLPTHNTRFKFNPCYRSSVNYSQSEKDTEILTELLGRADAIIENIQNSSASHTSPSNSTAASRVRSSPRKTPAATSNTTAQIASSNLPSASKSPQKQLLRRSARLENKSPATRTNIPQIDDDEVEEATNDANEEEETTLTNSTSLQRATPTKSPVSCPQPSPQKSPVFLPNRSQYKSKPQDREDFTKISHLISGNSNYYNVFCQVISCYSTSRGNTFLRVWDGTRNPRPTSFVRPQDCHILYGDKMKEKRVAADKKLYEVIAWEEHGGVAANLQSGDYVALINVHFYVPNSCSVPSLVMHNGEGKIKTDNGEFISAGRKIIKITPEVTKSGYEHIHDLITTNEPKLPHIEEMDDDRAKTPEVEGVSDSDWDHFINSSSTCAVQKNPTPKKTVSQTSTITVSSDGSSQSCQIISQGSPKRNIDFITTRPVQSSYPLTPRINLTQPIPSVITEPEIQKPTAQPSTISRSNVSNAKIQRPTSSIFARRPQSFKFGFQVPPSPKRTRYLNDFASPTNSQESQSTQTFLEKFKKIEKSDDDDDDMCDEERELAAITDEDMEMMWAIGENAILKPDRPIKK